MAKRVPGLRKIEFDIIIRREVLIGDFGGL
jgi:hypothetical protein